VTISFGSFGGNSTRLATCLQISLDLLSVSQFGRLFSSGRIRRVFLINYNKIVILKDGSIKTGGDEYKRNARNRCSKRMCTNLKQVMCLLVVDGVDFTHTYSNNCVKVHIRSYLNYRYLALLCDLMTQRGFLMAITRHQSRRYQSPHVIIVRGDCRLACWIINQDPKEGHGKVWKSWWVTSYWVAGSGETWHEDDLRRMT
jgi:hypothetical protein